VPAGHLGQDIILPPRSVGICPPSSTLAGYPGGAGDVRRAPTRDPKDIIFINPEDGTPQSFIRAHNK
jgi:hypothetical protein